RLEQWGFPVRTAATVRGARDLIVSFDPHVVISDLVLPDATGMALLQALRGGNDDRTVLLITAYGTIDTAVQAIKAGAADFLTKPLDYVALRKQLEAIDRELGAEARQTRSESTRRTESAAAERDGDVPLIGRSRAWSELQSRVRVAAASRAPVFVVG